MSNRKEELEKLEEQRAREKEQRLREAPFFANHPKVMTRRQMIARGFLAGASTVFYPGLINFLSEKRLSAHSYDCLPPGSSESPMAPFVVIDASGGNPLAAEFCVGGMGGQTDFYANYQNIGIPNALRNTPTLFDPDFEFGVALHKNSALLEGLRAGLPPQYRASVDGGVVCSQLDNDTSANPINASQLVAKIRYGTLVAAAGTSNSMSGGNSNLVQGSYDAKKDPVLCQNRNQARSIVDQGVIYTALANNKDRADMVRKALADMSEPQLSRFTNMNLSDQLKNLVGCGYAGTPDLLRQFDGTAVFPDTNIAEPVYNQLVTAFGATPENNSLAAVSRLVIGGFSGVGSFEEGGYDSHDGTARSTRNNSFKLGRHVGRVLHYAALLNKPVFIQLITDGSMGASTDTPDNVASTGTRGGPGGTPSADFQPNGEGYFARPGDSASQGLMAFFAYVPGKTRGDLIQSTSQAQGRQIGRFKTDGSGADTSFLSTSALANVGEAARAVAYNYLALHGQEDRISELSTDGRNPFTGQYAAHYLIFKRAIG